jgi:hypothetical protein
LKLTLSVITLLVLVTSVGAQTTQRGSFKCKGIGQCEGQQQGQIAKGGSATSTATGGSATATTGNEANNQSTSYNDTRQTAEAASGFQFHTSPCIKGWGAGAQSGWAGLSLGAGKIDKGCEARETAAEFYSMGSRRAACKVMVALDASVKAGITLDDCMEQYK